MMILIHKICMALRGLGKFIKVAREIKVSAAMLLWREARFTAVSVEHVCRSTDKCFGTHTSAV